MGKKSSIPLIAVGVVLVIVAIVWWAAIAPALTKLPSDVDTQMDFEGTLTLYVDPETNQPLPAGQEMALPITVLRTFSAVPELFTSSVAVFDDKLVLTVAGQESPPQITRYALDRKTRKCVESDENWAYAPQIVLADRVGNYGPLAPGGLKVGDTLSTFFNDPAKAFDITVVEKIDDYNGLGVTVMKIDASRPAAEYYPPIAQAFLGQGQGLPMEITFAQFSAQLEAKGLNLGAVLAALAEVATPEDMQALQAMTQQPIKLVYTQEGKDVLYVEKKTGATVGATFDRTTSMQPDTSGLVQALSVIGKYATDPTVGPMIANVVQAAGQLAQAGPTKIFNQTMSIIPTSEETLAASAKDKIPLLAWAKLGIPLIIVVIGALILVLGGFLFLRTRKSSSPAPAKPAAAKPAAAKKPAAKKPAAKPAPKKEPPAGQPPA